MKIHSRHWPTAAVMFAMFMLAATRANPDAIASAAAAEGDHKAAALEYRRLALEAGEPARQGGYLWAAALHYLRDGDYDRACLLLDKAEDADAGISATALLLRGETALADGKTDEAVFYWKGYRDSTRAPAARRYASRRLAEALVASGKTDEARVALRGDDPENTGGLTAIEQLKRGRDKNPTVGGLLGLIPGLGYAYSGEYGNALRSLILNGLFIFGMASTADDEQWGAFAVITFFELTWYSGSVYGGADAAQRYNQERRDNCREAIRGKSVFEIDAASLPVVSVQFKF